MLKKHKLANKQHFLKFRNMFLNSYKNRKNIFTLMVCGVDSWLSRNIEVPTFSHGSDVAFAKLL